MTTPRAILAHEHGALLALNNQHATELSWQSAQDFDALLARAWHARTAGAIGTGDALLIAFDQDAGYANPNFAWFAARHRRFVYIDRVVVAAHARGHGHADALYADLIARARAAGHVRLVCEVNDDPPNPASQAFHRSRGFAPVGNVRLDNGKQVDYLELEL